MQLSHKFLNDISVRLDYTLAFANLGISYMYNFINKVCCLNETHHIGLRALFTMINYVLSN